MEEEMHAKDDILDVWFVEGERPKRKDLDLRVMMDQRMELTRSAEEGWIELKDEKKYEVLFSPMPKELQVLMQMKEVVVAANEEYYCYLEAIIETRIVSTNYYKWYHIAANLYWDHKTHSIQPWQTQGTISIMRMNMSMSSMNKIHWITNH